MKQYLYYPGCSVKNTSRPYDGSLHATFRALGLELVELNDWNCCGATSYLSVDVGVASTLAARNLAIAERDGGRDLVVSCAGCFRALAKAESTIGEYPEVRVRVDEALKAVGLRYEGSVRVRHPLEVLMTDVGPAAIKKRIVRPLKDFRVVPYYGCAILRPYAIMDDPYAPRVMEDLFRTAGATPVDYAYKGRCCGGCCRAMFAGGLEKIGLRLVEILLEEAKRSEADAIATTCPVCQINLECYQDRISKQTGKDLHIPVLYFTQVLGMAMGLADEDLGIDKLFIPPRLAQAVRA